MLKVVSWNIAHRQQPWRDLLGMDADTALLQEAAKPPPQVIGRVVFDASPWHTAGADGARPWRAAVVKLSDRVRVDWIETKAIEMASPGELAVSRPGTLAAAKVTSSDGEPVIFVSMYAPWTAPHASTASG